MVHTPHMLLAPPNQHTRCIEPHYTHSQGAHHWLCSLAQALCPVRLILSCRHTECACWERDSELQRPALLPPSWGQGQGQGQDPLQLYSARSPFLVPVPDIPATLSHLRGHTLFHFLRGLKGEGWCPLKDAQQSQQQPHFLPAVLGTQARLPADHLPKRGGLGVGESSGQRWSHSLFCR